VAVWRIIDGAKPYRFTTIGKDRRAKTGRGAMIEKLCAHGQSSQIGMLSIHFGTRPTRSYKSKRQLICAPTEGDEVDSSAETAK
jgi:hypothetical protein